MHTFRNTSCATGDASATGFAVACAGLWLGIGGASTASAAGGVPTSDRAVVVVMAWGPHRDEISSVPADNPTGRRTASGVKCPRFYAAAGTGSCLRAEHGGVQDSRWAVVLDKNLKEHGYHPLPGIPTRARVSPSGYLAAWTVFVGGDSRAGTNFSTRTAILDTRTGRPDSNLESFRAVRDGKTVHAADTDFWGVTFADDEHFYATTARVPRAT